MSPASTPTQERLRSRAEAGVIDAAGDDLGAEVVFIAIAGGRRRPRWPAASSTTTGRLADAVVTDVSGVKTAIVDEADHPRFIGGHPMAGSEQTGLHGADPDLFVGAVWALTPTATTDLEAFDRLKGVVTSLGADVLVLSAADHDRLVAVVSHVPHLVAATLMNAATDGAEQDGTLLRLAAGGFRDMTRVAAGHPGHLARHLRRERHGHRRRARRTGDRPQRHARPCGGAGPGRDPRRRSRRPARPGATCRPVPCAPTTWPSCASRCPTATASWPRSRRWRPIRASASTTSRSRTRPRALWRPHPGGRWSRRRHPHRRRGGARVPRRAEQLVMTAPRALVVDGGTPAAAPSGRRARSRSRTGPSSSAPWPRACRSSTGSPTVPTWPPRWPPSRRWGPASERHDDGTSSSTGAGRVSTGPTAPLDCGQFGDVHAPAGGPGGRVRLGDRAGRRRVALVPAHGPGGRAPRAHGRHGDGSGRALRAAPARRVAGCTASTGRPRWPAPRSSRPSSSPGCRPTGTTVVREAVTTRTHTEEMLLEAGADLTVEPWGEGRIVRVRASSLQPVERDRARRPLRIGLLRRGGMRRARERRRCRRRLQRPGPARLRLRPPADGRDHHASRRRPRVPRRSGRWPGPLRPRRCGPARSPRSTRFPLLAVAAAVAEGTTVFSDVGELRVKEVDRLAAVADMVEAFGAHATIDGDALVDHRSRRPAARRAASTARATTGWRWRPPWRRWRLAGRTQPHHRVRGGRDQLPDLRRGHRATGRRLGAPAAAAGRHRRAGRAGKSTVSTAVAERLGVNGSTRAPCTGRSPPSPWSWGTAAGGQRGGGRPRRVRRRSRWGSGSTIDGRDVTGRHPFARGRPGCLGRRRQSRGAPASGGAPAGLGQPPTAGSGRGPGHRLGRLPGAS